MKKLDVNKAEIQKDGKYLIIKRSPNAHIYPNHWDFPGGKVDPGEDDKTALAREVREETNLVIEVLEKVHEFTETGFSTTYADISARMYVWKTKLLSGSVTLSDEHTAYRWATKEEMRSLLLEPFLKDYLEKL